MGSGWDETSLHLYVLRTTKVYTVSNGAHLGGGTHFITIAEEQYPAYYDVFQHVFNAMAASFDGFPVVVQSVRTPEQFRWVLQPRTRIRLSLPLDRTHTSR